MWEIIGFDTQVNEAGGVTAYTIYCTKENTGDNRCGLKCKREWYRTENVSYVPQIGDKVIIEKEDYGKFSVITEIYRF